ncbi:acid protease, partial [Mollisia scopiformis]
MPEPLQSAWNRLQSREEPGLATRDNGQTITTSDGLFLFPLRIGSPQQMLNLIFDTGSGDFWVWSWLMPDTQTSGRNYYNGSNSSTATRWQGQSFGVDYSAGSLHGLVWQDAVWVDNIGVGGNPIECAQDVAPFFLNLEGADGVLGLSNAFNDSESPAPQQTWLTWVLPRLPASVFTVALSPKSMGTIDFGFIDSSKYIGTIAYTPVTIIPGTTGGFWAFNWTGFAIGDQKFNYTNIQVMVDTGGNISQLPQSILKKFFAQVKGAYQQSDGGWNFPCASAVPNLTFGVGNSRIVISGKNFIFNPLADGINCYSAVQGTSDGSYVYMNVPFLESIFVVHDYGAMRMGFANRTWT